MTDIAPAMHQSMVTSIEITEVNQLIKTLNKTPFKYQMKANRTIFEIVMKRSSLRKQTMHGLVEESVTSDGLTHTSRVHQPDGFLIAVQRLHHVQSPWTKSLV